MLVEVVLTVFCSLFCDYVKAYVFQFGEIAQKTLKEYIIIIINIIIMLMYHYCTW